MTIWTRGDVPGVQSGEQSDLKGDQSRLERTQREAARVLVAENRWSLPRAGTTRKGVRMALLSQGPPGLVPSHGRHDAPPRRVLPLVAVV